METTKQRSLLERLNEVGSERLSDSVIPNMETKEEHNDDNVEVIVRKVVKPSATDSNKGKNKGEIFIHAENDTVEIGNEVTMDDEPVEDGIYECEVDGESTKVAVEGGLVTAIGDEAIEDLTKLMIRGGQLIKKKIRTVKKRMTSAQRAALVKARKFSHTAKATKGRLKSFKKGQMKGLHNAEQAEDFIDIKKVDLNKLGDSLYSAVFKYISDRYELKEEEIDQLDDMLAEEACKPVVDGQNLKFNIPVWTEEEGSVDLGKFDMIEIVYELKGEFDQESIEKGLTESELKMQSSLIV